MSVRKKGQVSLEFLVLVGFLAVMSFGFIFAASIQLKDYSDNEKSEIIQDFGNSIKRELNLAGVVKDGYNRKLTLPEQISGTIDYSITVTGETLIIRTDIEDYSAIVPNTKGTLVKNADNFISKVNNTIIITQ